jgi:glycosyltransferase involved in cell wall biosynthesis
MDKPVKIGLIGPVYPYRGGIAHFTTLLAKKLIEAGHEVRVISFKKQYPAWLYPGESDKDHSPGRVKVAADYVLTPLNPLSWRKTVRALADFHPQQVILPWWVTFWGPAFQCVIAGLKRRGIPVTLLIHNTMPHEARLMDRFLARRTLKRADRYIVMTEKEKNRLLTLLPGAAPIHSAPLPIYHAFKPTGLPKAQVRHKLGLPEDQPILFYFGFVRPYKGLGVLIDALKILVDKELNPHLLIVGEFWEDKSGYLDQIQSLGLNNHVHIFDSYIPDDEVAAFFEAADLFVAPYIGGTQSAALKSALGFGLPVVVTDMITDAMIDSLPDRCRVVPAGEPTALAEGILAQINVPIQDPDQIEQMVAQSWEPMLTVISKDLR